MRVDASGKTYAGKEGKVHNGEIQTYDTRQQRERTKMGRCDNSRQMRRMESQSEAEVVRQRDHRSQRNVLCAKNLDIGLERLFPKERRRRTGTKKMQ